MLYCTVCEERIVGKILDHFRLEHPKLLKGYEQKQEETYQKIQRQKASQAHSA